MRLFQLRRRSISVRTRGKKRFSEGSVDFSDCVALCGGSKCCNNVEQGEGKGSGRNPLSPDRSKHVDVRYHSIQQDLVGTEKVQILHENSGWQHADILAKPLSMNLFPKHRRALTNLEGD